LISNPPTLRIITDNSQQKLGPKRPSSLSTTRAAKRRNTMYYAITTTFAALTVFVPTFIGMRDRTNANWRSR